MARYAVGNNQAGTQQNLTTTYKTQVSVTAATAGPVTRGTVLDISFGASGPPNSTDCDIYYSLDRTTGTLGTGTSATPSPIDNLSSACATVGTVCFTAEPGTFGANLYAIPLNQRSSLRVFFDQGFHWPAINTTGIAGRADSPTYTSTVGYFMLFDE